MIIALPFHDNYIYLTDIHSLARDSTACSRVPFDFASIKNYIKIFSSSSSQQKNFSHFPIEHLLAHTCANTRQLALSLIAPGHTTPAKFVTKSSNLAQNLCSKHHKTWRICVSHRIKGYLYGI